jgi:hypothetical protein
MIRGFYLRSPSTRFAYPEVFANNCALEVRMAETKSWKLVGIAAGVLLVAAAAVADDTKGKDGAGEGEKLPYKLTYSIQTGDNESNQVAVDTKGVVTTSIAYSVQYSPIRAIGRSTLEAGPSDPDLVAIGKTIAVDQLANGRPYATPQEAGTLYVVLDIEQDGKQTKHVVDAVAPLPDPLGGVAVMLWDLMTRAALKAPQRAASFHPKLDRETAAPGDRIRLTVDIRNGGSSRADLRNFAGFGQNGAGEFKVDFSIPPANRGEPPKFVSSVDVAGSEWHVADGTALRAKDPYLKLPGSGSLQVWTDIRVPEVALPGALQASLVYHAHAAKESERGNDALVVGLYAADPVPLTIVPRPAR